jgi:hypothetical protein
LLSFPRGGAIFDLRDKLFERSTAMLVILELIEAGACRRQQNHVSGPRLFARQLHGAIERLRAN